MKSVKSREKASINTLLPAGDLMVRREWTIAREASLSCPYLVTTESTAICEPVVPWTIVCTRAGCAAAGWVSNAW